MRIKEAVVDQDDQVVQRLGFDLAARCIVCNPPLDNMREMTSRTVLLGPKKTV
jgi:hypothetical protein